MRDDENKHSAAKLCGATTKFSFSISAISACYRLISDKQLLFIAIFSSIEHYEKLKNWEFDTPARPIFDPNAESKVHIVESEEDFDSQMKNAGNKLVIIGFMATWCGPCKNMSPHLDAFADKYESQITVLKVDVDALKELAMFKFRVSSIPTFTFSKNGKIVTRVDGADVKGIEEAINKYTE